ncbi:MAG: ribosome biogenesis GTPase Der [Chitinophagales bacterium]|nr:ribosome biogenesis GTPase Der [Chitinophagales bacterium]
MSFTVAIIGRPNVGKSTLFNRMVGSRDSIVDNLSGVTRDRQYGISYWNGKEFNVIDTGGFVPRSEDVFEAAIREQVEIAIQESNLIVFMTDVTTGITDLDDEMANMLRQTTKPVLLLVNKVDNANRLLEAQEFWRFGFENTFFVSSITGSGSGEMLDKLTEYISEEDAVLDNTDHIAKIAIIGQPNVGKSSLTNALLGETRNIVTPIAGTTRDTIHSMYNNFGMEAMLIDTAGIRKKTRTMENLEFYSIIRAFKAIDEADVVMLVIDAENGLEAQDLSLYRLVEKKHKGIIVLVNKWDLVTDKETNTARDYEAFIKKRLAPFNDVPILFISALEKTRIYKAMEMALAINEKRKKRVTTSELNNWLAEVTQAYQPPIIKGKKPKIKYLTQLPLAYPSFAFFCNLPQYIKEPYKNYLQNKFRANWDFTGVPVTFYFRKK